VGARQEPAESGGEREKRPVAPSTAYARWWFGVAGVIDFLSLPAAADACALNTQTAAPVNSAGYYCTNPDGSDFPSRVSGASPAILLGARLGYVINTYPTGDAAVHEHHAFGSRVHFEARGTYVFGDAPLTHEGFAPTVFVAAGMAEFDGHVATIASMNQKGSTVPYSQPVNAWLTNGPWFLALGGGARYQLSPRAAFNALIRANAAFGGGALLTFGPEIAFQYGL